MNYEAMIRFLMVVDEGSFAAAARKLRVSRQAIHRSVDALEREYGASLFDRGASKLRLTDLGQRLVPYARTIRDAGWRASALLSSATTHPTGTIKLTAPPLFAEAMMTRAISSFLADYPEVNIVAQFSTSRTDLHRDDYDLMIRIGAAPPADTYAQLLGQAKLCLCASPAYLASHGAPQHPDQLSGHQLLEYANEGPATWWFERDHESYTLPVQTRLTSNLAKLTLRACLDGLGILKVPQLAVTEALAAGELAVVLAPWRMPVAEVWAIYGHRSPTDPTLAALLKALREIPWSG